MPLKDASAYSGMALWHLRTLVWTKKIGHAKLGKRVLVEKSDLDRYIDSKFIPAGAR